MNIMQTVLSSIGQKVLLATSGLVMFLLFLIPHMGGNILFLFGPDLFNSYASHLHQLKPIVVGIEVLMLVSIIAHMNTGIRIAVANRLAAGQRESLKSTPERSLAAKLMPWTGAMIFIFIAKHLFDFTLGVEKAQVELNGHMVNDVYGMVYAYFQSPGNVLFYLLFMVAVGFHLSHALQSALQTYGLYIPREGSKIKLLSKLVAIAMASTFAIIPVSALIYFYY